MKNNKALIVVGIILLNVLVVFMFCQSLLGKSSQYESTLQQARAYAKNDLCSKAITEYNEAVLSKDTLEVRLEMIEVYDRGIEIGEFTDTYDVFTTVTSMVDQYQKEIGAYEAACDLFLKYDKFEECANILMQARDLNVTSDKIEEAREQVRYKYTEYFSMYTEVLPAFDGMYTVIAEDVYSFINDEGSPEIDSSYTYASSFSEGYAFVKSEINSEGEKSFVINKEGERQVYFDSVETSSGVGKAKNKDAKDIYLLACKVGDKYKYYDLSGKVAFGEYLFAGRFRNNVAAVEVSEGSWKLINGAGESITDKTFEDVVLNEFDECAPKGFIFAKTGSKYHLYDLNGNQIGDFACDEAKAFVDEYAAFRNGELWGFVDAEGKVIIEPKYSDAKSFSNSMGAVKVDSGWQFISPSDVVVIEKVFEDVGYLSDKGLCFVKDSGYWSYLKMYYTGK